MRKIILLSLVVSLSAVVFGQERPRDERIRGVMELSVEVVDIDKSLKRDMYPILPSFFEVKPNGDTSRIYNLFVKLPVGGSNSSGQSNAEFFKERKAHWVEAVWVKVTKKGYTPVAPPSDPHKPPKNVALVVFNWGTLEKLPELSNSGSFKELRNKDKKIEPVRRF